MFGAHQTSLVTTASLLFVLGAASLPSEASAQARGARTFVASTAAGARAPLRRVGTPARAARTTTTLRSARGVRVTPGEIRRTVTSLRQRVADLRIGARDSLEHENPEAGVMYLREAGMAALTRSSRLMVMHAYAEAHEVLLDAARGSFGKALTILGAHGDGRIIEQTRESQVEALFAAARYHAMHVETGGSPLAHSASAVFDDYARARDAAQQYGQVARAQTIARNGGDALSRIGSALGASAPRTASGAAQLRRASTQLRDAASLYTSVGDTARAHDATQAAARFEREASRLSDARRGRLRRSRGSRPPREQDPRIHRAPDFARVPAVLQWHRACCA